MNSLCVYDWSDGWSLDPHTTTPRFVRLLLFTFTPFPRCCSPHIHTHCYIFLPLRLFIYIFCHTFVLHLLWSFCCLFIVLPSFVVTVVRYILFIPHAIHFGVVRYTPHDGRSFYVLRLYGPTFALHAFSFTFHVYFTHLHFTLLISLLSHCYSFAHYSFDPHLIYSREACDPIYSPHCIVLPSTPHWWSGWWWWWWWVFLLLLLFILPIWCCWCCCVCCCWLMIRHFVSLSPSLLTYRIPHSLFVIPSHYPHSMSGGGGGGWWPLDLYCWFIPVYCPHWRDITFPFITLFILTLSFIYLLLLRYTFCTFCLFTNIFSFTTLPHLHLCFARILTFPFLLLCLGVRSFRFVEHSDLRLPHNFTFCCYSILESIVSHICLHSSLHLPHLFVRSHFTHFPHTLRYLFTIFLVFALSGTDRRLTPFCIYILLTIHTTQRHSLPFTSHHILRIRDTHIRHFVTLRSHICVPFILSYSPHPPPLPHAHYLLFVPPIAQSPVVVTFICPFPLIQWVGDLLVVIHLLFPPHLHCCCSPTDYCCDPIPIVVWRYSPLVPVINLVFVFHTPPTSGPLKQLTGDSVVCWWWYTAMRNLIVVGDHTLCYLLLFVSFVDGWWRCLVWWWWWPVMISLLMMTLLYCVSIDDHSFHSMQWCWHCVLRGGDSSQWCRTPSLLFVVFIAHPSPSPLVWPPLPPPDDCASWPPPLLS